MSCILWTLLKEREYMKKEMQDGKNYLTKRDVGKIFKMKKNAVNLLFSSYGFPRQEIKVDGKPVSVVEAVDCIVYFGYLTMPVQLYGM